MRGQVRLVLVPVQEVAEVAGLVLSRVNHLDTLSKGAFARVSGIAKDTATATRT